MTNVTISHRYMRMAESVRATLSQSLARRRLAPVFSDFYITHLAGMTPLIAVLDTAKIGDHGPYTRPELLHQLSTDLGGMPVYLSNHSGIRYVVLLSQLPKLPRRVDLPPDVPRGKLALGVRFTGQPVVVDWESLKHLAVLGATGSGKSVFLQSLALQACRDEMRLLVSDIDQLTFGMLDGSPHLGAPVARSEQEAFGLVERAIGEFETRAALFVNRPERPQKLSEYNALPGVEPLPRILVILDEASSVLTALGGARGEMGKSLATLGYRGRKFGVHFVFAAQEFTKAVMGPVRDQVGLSVCFRVASGQMAAIMGCKGAERIPESRPGLAISNRHGPMQAYFVEAASLGDSERALPVISDDERVLAERAWFEADGKVSREALMGLGLGQQEARRLQADWRMRGWARNDPARANGLYITPKLVKLLTNRPTQPTLTSPDQPATSPTSPF